jgi:DNA-binding CsgD family transcriptional regulator
MKHEKKSGTVRKLTEIISTDKQDKIIELLDEILRWTRLQGVQNARAVLITALKTDTDKIIYHLSDGRPSGEIAKVCGVTGMSVRRYWRRWFTLGITQPSKKYKRRFERSFSLADLGIEVPAMPAASATIKERAEQEESEEALVDE